MLQTDGLVQEMDHRVPFPPALGPRFWIAINRSRAQPRRPTSCRFMPEFLHAVLWLIVCMSESVLKKNNYLALTEPGKRWVRKALHPAEETIKAPRIPCRGIKPTATQETIMTFNLQAPDTIEEGQTWGAALYIRGDPLCPLVVIKNVESGGTGTDYGQTLLNQSFTSAVPYGDHVTDNFAETLANFQKSCEQYRLTALSVTGHFTGAALTSQGSVVAAQVSDPNAEYVIEYGADPVVARQARIWGQDYPSMETLVTGTTPYSTAAREGFYMPYKMESPETWHRSDQVYSLYRRSENVPSTVSALPYTDFTANSYCYPPGNGTSRHFPAAWLNPVDSNLGAIALKGLDATTTFRVTVRVCLEMMTRPASAFACFAEAPAPPDEHALAMYYEIASRLSDCYPASYNADGTLWERIKRVAGIVWKIASPILSFTELAPIVPVVNAARGAYKATSRATKAVIKAVQRRNSKDVASQKKKTPKLKYVEK